MTKLTKAEEEIMQIIWKLERCTVKNIRETLGGNPLPPHSTISSIVRILDKKGFVGHKAFGRTYEYFPTITKDDYGKKTIRDLVGDYFGGSMNSLVSFLVKENDLDIEALNELIKENDKTKDS